MSMMDKLVNKNEITIVDGNPRMCSKCGCGTWWRPTSRGTLWCAVCSPPKPIGKAKVVLLVIHEPDGSFSWEDLRGPPLAGMRAPDGSRPIAVKDGIPIYQHEDADYVWYKDRSGVHIRQKADVKNPVTGPPIGESFDTWFAGLREMS